MTTQPPTAEYTVLKSVRLTGRFNSSALEIVTKRDETELGENLEIRADDPPNVRVEVFDFVHDDGTTRTTWELMGDSNWTRASNHVWKVFSDYTDGEIGDTLDIVARPQGSTDPAQEKPKQIYIEIKPVVDGPDKS
ncbi:hypothetical protein PPSIR1_20909 [Plesiocystis pacifica SIR-1]|uniref:Uncharacterized protein n=1 Tax=Plesiocystis pacifica SIR-1 TaxID=391625 RepID=A6G3C1_9BACT|nr:hypothetical protein [Plesiocystis pacifica]EDM79528.1 hypothetical protein PPSIR1_20909 [Plesiocystis pacifica SIR-1]